VVSAAFHRDIAHLEVGLRSAYNRAIVTRTPAGLSHWTTDPYRLFPVRWRAAALVSTRTAPLASRSNAPFVKRDRVHPPGKVIAELMFGFWRYLSTTAHHDALWIPTCTPHSRRARAAARLIDRWAGYQLRNRIAHHEPLLRRNSTTGEPAVVTRIVDAPRSHDPGAPKRSACSPAASSARMTARRTPKSIDHKDSLWRCGLFG
jgi:hypothetical protein